MKTTPKIIAMLMALVLCGSLLAGCGGDGGAESSASGQNAGASAAEDGAYTITMAYIGSEQPNEESVLAAVQEQVKADTEFNLELIQLGFGDYQQKLNLMLSGGDKLDVFPIGPGLAGTYKNAGQLVELTELIDTHGQGIVELMGEGVAKSGSLNGFVYGLPSNKESASRNGFVMRKDVVEELGIDVESINTMDEMTAVFEQVKAAHPELDCVAGTNLVIGTAMWDTLGDSFGVLMDCGKDREVTNLFESEEYHKRVSRIHDWYQKGYVKLDAATSTETTQNLMKSGSLFCYMSSIKPGFLVQEEAATGMELVTTYIDNDDGSMANIICTGNVNYFDWGIAAQSEDPEKAMEFLNYIYTSPEWNNLMNFGIEGQDYVRVEESDVLIDYPEGTDASSVYHLNMGWMLPNQFIGYVWNGQPEDIWEQYQDFNASATYSVAFGFLPDTSSLATELTALSSVNSEYNNALVTGSVSNVDTALSEFNEKLYAAGLQKVMDLKQEQLDAWFEAQGN